jgi:hypothetical protein
MMWQPSMLSQYYYPQQPQFSPFMMNFGAFAQPRMYQQPANMPYNFMGSQNMYRGLGPMGNQMGMMNNVPTQMQGRTPGAPQGPGANAGSQPNGAAPNGQMTQGQVPQHT